MKGGGGARLPRFFGAPPFVGLKPMRPPGRGFSEVRLERRKGSNPSGCSATFPLGAKILVLLFGLFFGREDEGAFLLLFFLLLFLTETLFCPLTP